MRKRGTQEDQAAQKKAGMRMLKKGLKIQQIAEVLEVSRQTVYNWRDALKESDGKISLAQKRGRIEGEQRSLTYEQECRVQVSITDYDPEQLKFPFALWTRKAIQQLIKELYGIEMPLRTISGYLSRWGFTPQRPQKRAYERKDPEVQKWLKETYPEIKNKAKNEGGEIHWADETHIQSMPNNLRGFAPKGKTPTLKHTAKKLKINMISSITNRGVVRFMTYRDSMNASKFIKFLKRLVQASERKVFLIVDNLRVHHSRKVKEWLEEVEDQIELYYLPAYCPDLNPDEYLNCDLKRNVHGHNVAKNQSDLESNTMSFMRKLQKNPSRGAAYFKHQKIAYAS